MCVCVCVFYFTLSFNSVSFSYSANKNIFNKLNLEFNKNRIYGISGTSGTGKTTFVNLACGLLSPSNGKIYYNDSNIKKE